MGSARVHTYKQRCCSPKRLPGNAGETTHVSLRFIILTGQALQQRHSYARSADMKHGPALASWQPAGLRWQRCKTGIKSSWLPAGLNKHGVDVHRCSTIVSVLNSAELFSIKVLSLKT